jgi:plasmid stabilization system protein ParE
VKHIRFISAARQEFLAEVAYYNEIQPGLGARFTTAVENATARALAFPLAGSPAISNTRRVVLKDFPFSIFYRSENSGIVIFAVSHQSRRPAYWISRAGSR